MSPPRKQILWAHCIGPAYSASIVATTSSQLVMLIKTVASIAGETIIEGLVQLVEVVV